MKIARAVLLATILVGQSARFKQNDGQTDKSKCDGLRDIAIKGHNFTSSARFLCEFWPKGNFPLMDVNKYSELLEIGLSKGGLWKLFMKASDAQRSKFCYKSVVPRLREGEGQMLANGFRYSRCPNGYRDPRLIKGFVPICVSACTETINTVGCLLGCARSKLSCALTLMRQVMDVANIIGNIKKLLFNNPMINELLNQVRSISDFTLGTFRDVKNRAEQHLAKFANKDQTSAVVLTTLYTFIDEAPILKAKPELFKNMIKDTAAMFEDTFDRLFQGDFSPQGIGNAVGRYGKYVLKQAAISTDLFVTNRCTPLNREIFFTIEDAGSEPLIGPYYRLGLKNSRPKYFRKSSERARLAFIDDQWRLYLRDSATGIFWESKYRTRETTMDFPTTGWYKTNGATDPIPELVKVREPQYCDWQCYIDRYADIKAKCGVDHYCAKQHYIDNGVTEGRTCDCGMMCNWQCYLDRYYDLQDAFGPYNTEAAYQHWVRDGKKEGRICTC